jgi:hypothetical protein
MFRVKGTNSKVGGNKGWKEHRFYSDNGVDEKILQRKRNKVVTQDTKKALLEVTTEEKTSRKPLVFASCDGRSLLLRRAQ